MIVPYEDERAGLAAIRAIAKAEVVEEFGAQLAERHNGVLPDLPPFQPNVLGKPRRHILAIDGSSIYEAIPGALPCTEAGLVSLGVVVIDTGKLFGLDRLPESGAMNPRELRATEAGETLGTMLPGRNAAKQDGTDPRTWFRQIINREFGNAKLGDESFAETLYSLLGDDRKIKGPNINCDADGIPIPSFQGSQ